MFKLILRQITAQAGKRYASGITTSTFADTSTSASKELICVKKSLEEWTEKLRHAGIGDIEFNLKCLVAHVLRRKFNTLPFYEKVELTVEQHAEFQRLCEARCARMPLQYILGEWDFMNLTLRMAPSVFIPRPETEEFVAKVIEQYRERCEDENAAPVNMLEIGCGTGAMSLAMLHELPQLISVAIERSKIATTIAADNARRLKLDERFEVYLHTMEKTAFLPKELKDMRFELIISNPPYVKRQEFQHLQPEVTLYENPNALDGGPDGLSVARIIFDLACVHLRPGGKLWMELGQDHPALVKTIMLMKYKDKLKYENPNALDGGPDGLSVARIIFDLACVHLRPGGKLWMELGQDHPALVKTIMLMKYKDKLKYENPNALDGGPDGLSVARIIFDLACVHLRPGGKLWMELGQDHPALVKTIMLMKYKDKLKYIAGYYDQYKVERFVEIERI